MSRRMTQLSALLAQGLAACALCMATPCQAETLEFPGSPLKRSFDGIFSSLIPDAPSSNTVIVREGAIPGRVYGGSAKGEGTVSGNTGTLYAGGIRFEHMAGFVPGKATIINTIAVGNTMGGNESNFSVTDVLKDSVNSRNCFFGLASEADQATDSLCGDPLFVDAASGDYHLLEGSPAKEAGSTYAYIGKDLDDKYFVWDTPSIGCYEFDPDAQPRPWDIPGPNGGGIQALDDYEGHTYVEFTSIDLSGDTLTVGFRAGKVDARGEVVVALLCKENLDDDTAFRLPATLTNGSLDTLGVLEAVLDQPYPHLFAVGIGTIEE